jgi:hypothetical protein
MLSNSVHEPRVGAWHQQLLLALIAPLWFLSSRVTILNRSGGLDGATT